MTTYILLTLGGMLFGAFVYRYDTQEREPWWMLMLAILAGALAMAGAFVMEYGLLLGADQAGLSHGLTLVHAALAGVVEELAKFAIPLAVLLLYRKQFNDPMDGLIYGCMGGLGGALFESAWFMLNAPTRGNAGMSLGWLPLLRLRDPDAVRLLMHTCWGGIGGFALGLIVMKKPWRLALTKGLGGAIALHFVWAFVVGFSGQQSFLHRLVAALTLGTTVVVFAFLTYYANRWSRQMHAPPKKQKLTTRIIRAVLTRKFK